MSIKNGRLIMKNLLISNIYFFQKKTSFNKPRGYNVFVVNLIEMSLKISSKSSLRSNFIINKLYLLIKFVIINLTKIVTSIKVI